MKRRDWIIFSETDSTGFSVWKVSWPAGLGARCWGLGRRRAGEGAGRVESGPDKRAGVQGKGAVAGATRCGTIILIFTHLTFNHIP